MEVEPTQVHDDHHRPHPVKRGDNMPLWHPNIRIIRKQTVLKYSKTVTSGAPPRRERDFKKSLTSGPYGSAWACLCVGHGALLPNGARGQIAQRLCSRPWLCRSIPTTFTIQGPYAASL